MEVRRGGLVGGGLVDDGEMAARIAPATVRRVVIPHGGRTRADAAVGLGAAFVFTRRRDR